MQFRGSETGYAEETKVGGVVVVQSAQRKCLISPVYPPTSSHICPPNDDVDHDQPKVCKLSSVTMHPNFGCVSSQVGWGDENRKQYDAI